MTLKLDIYRKTSGERGSYMRIHYTITLLRNIQFYKPKTALKTLINLQKWVLVAIHCQNEDLN